ncbi:hypothetical protein [Terricaulis sp.]|nr:hypothetical protein [Terricaulis sp.]MDZ4693461.1 hypothetical protein [Terricaulis sp.]
MSEHFIWTAGALAGTVQPAQSLLVETPYAGEGAGGPDYPRHSNRKPNA